MVCVCVCVVQERKSVANAGLRVRRLTGEDIKPAHWEAFYQGYINTTGTLPLPPCLSTCMRRPCRLHAAASNQSGGSENNLMDKLPLMHATDV